MSRKRSLTDRELEEFANMDEDEWDNFLKDNSDDDPDYETFSEQSSTSESDRDPIQPPEVPNLDAEGIDFQDEPPEQPNLDAEWVKLRKSHQILTF